MNNKSLFGRHLPSNIINLIFEFDNTKHEAFNRCLNQFRKGCYDARCSAKRFLKEEKDRMVNWVDNLYSPTFGTRWAEDVHMDGRYIKTVMYMYPIPVLCDSEYETISRRYFREREEEGRVVHDEFKISPGDEHYVNQIYSYEYQRKSRNWNNSQYHWRLSARIRKGLHNYEDKAIFRMKVCTDKKVQLVPNIIKNIKKWEKKNPQLCNY